jgi:hypothetical protein
MIDEFYARVAMLNSNPDLLEGKSEEEKTKLKSALDNITKYVEASDKVLEKVLLEFIQTFDNMNLVDKSEIPKSESTRGLSLKKGTNLPRQLINDVTILTLKNF